MKVGMVYELSHVVDEKDTAAALGSGSILVLSTPYLITLMEMASMECVKDCLGDGFTTVGIKVDMEHIKATPVGMTVNVKATLTKIDDKILSFSVEAFDQKEKIGTCNHHRFIIKIDEFMIRTNAKILKN